MILKSLNLVTFKLGGCGVLKGLILDYFDLREGVVVMKEWIFTIFTLGRCGGPEEF